MQATILTGEMRILVIDDNADAADMLAEMLNMFGFRAIAVHDGRSGIAQAVLDLPHLVFLDLGMPGLDGFDVARAIRGLPGAQGVRIVALTAWNDRATVAKLARSDFDDHITKPATVDQLLAAIEAAG